MSDNAKVVDLNKVESQPKTTVPSSSAREIGQPHIITSSNYIQDSKKKDLKDLPRRLCTFDNMLEDDAVYNSVDITNLHVVNALYKGKFVAKRSGRSKIAADFLNYCIRNMTVGTWYEACLNAVTDLQYGFSMLNIVTEVRKHGKWKGNRVIRKLAPRDQKSVYGWLWDKNFREFMGFVQRPPLIQGKSVTGFENGLTALSIPKYEKLNYPIIKKDQLLHFAFNKTNNNPQGKPPLMACYGAWMEKKLIEKYECIGVSKDLAGAVVLRVPSELIERANDSTNYPEEAAEYAQLQQDAANLQAGETSYIVLTSDVDEVSKKYLYDIKLQGIEGGGKQYQTSDIIDQKRKSIYNTFGTGFLLLGQNGGGGSYNLSTTGTSTHGYYVERSINQKIDVINSQLAPRLLAINNIFLDWDDMPEFVAADPTEFDLDILSKFIQRTKSVGGITPQVLEYLYDKAGLPIDGIEDLVFDDGDTSRGGESQGSSGTGNTQSGGANSATNTENAGTKSLIVDGDRIVDTETDKVVNLEDLNDNGEYS